MNMVEMADRLAARTGLSKSAAKEAVDGVFGAIGNAIGDGEEVRIAGFRGLRHHAQLGPYRTQPQDRPANGASRLVMGSSSGTSVSEMGRSPRGC